MQTSILLFFVVRHYIAIRKLMFLKTSKQFSLYKL